MLIKDLELDLSVYPLNAIRKAAAAISDRYSSHIEQCSEHKVKITFTTRGENIALDEASKQFLVLALDFTQQEVINEQTADVRTALIRAALSEALK